jgi:hypothetical protein
MKFCERMDNTIDQFHISLLASCLYLLSLERVLKIILKDPNGFSANQMENLHKTLVKMQFRLRKKPLRSKHLLRPWKPRVLDILQPDGRKLPIIT